MVVIKMVDYENTTWSPDTCPCRFTFSSTDTDGTVTFDLVHVIQWCYDHKDVSDDDLMETVRADNASYGESSPDVRQARYDELVALGITYNTE